MPKQSWMNKRMIPTIIFFIGWFIILLVGTMSLKTKSKCWFKWVFWLWSHNIRGPLHNLYPKRENGSNSTLLPKAMGLIASTRDSVKGKSCNVFRSRWYYTNYFSQQLWRGDNYLNRYFISARHSVWQIVLKKVQLNTLWDTTTNDIEKHVGCWSISLHQPNGKNHL